MTQELPEDRTPETAFWCVYHAYRYNCLNPTHQAFIKDRVAERMKEELLKLAHFRTVLERLKSQAGVHYHSQLAYITAGRKAFERIHIPMCCVLSAPAIDYVLESVPGSHGHAKNADLP